MSVVRPFTTVLGTLEDNDDDTTPLVDLGFSFYGYTACWIGNNGGITFQRPFDTLGIFDLTNYEMREVWQFGHAVYPIWADWDTRPSPSGEPFGIVRYGLVGRCFSVAWEDVGIFSARDQAATGDTRRARFQLIITASGGIEFNYDRVEVDVGEASYGNETISGSYENPTEGVYPDGQWYWDFPIVGYSLPVGDYLIPRPERIAVYDEDLFNRSYPTDPILGEMYLTQGLSGLTDGGPNALSSNSNVGVPGRWRYLWSGGDCGATPPLRQNQRDDARQNQRTSQQLTVRQRGYL